MMNVKLSMCHTEWRLGFVLVHSQSFSSVVPGWGLSTSIANMYPGNAEAVNLEPIHRELRLRNSGAGPQ